jgi:hypothetical protein
LEVKWIQPDGEKQLGLNVPVSSFEQLLIFHLSINEIYEPRYHDATKPERNCNEEGIHFKAAEKESEHRRRAS